MPFKSLSFRPLSLRPPSFRLGRRFRRSRRGVAALEFALLAPVLALLLLGSTEVTHLIWANGRLNAATAAVGNVLTQERTINNDTFREVLEATPMIMGNYMNNSLKFMVTSAVACYEDGKSEPTYVVSWSRGWTNASATAGLYPARTRVASTDMSQLLKNMQIQAGDSVIVVHGEYVYKSRGGTSLTNLSPTYDMSKYVTYQPRVARRLYFTGVENSPQLSCANLL